MLSENAERLFNEGVIYNIVKDAEDKEAVIQSIKNLYVEGYDCNSIEEVQNKLTIMMFKAMTLSNSSETMDIAEKLMSMGYKIKTLENEKTDEEVTKFVTDRIKMIRDGHAQG